MKGAKSDWLVYNLNLCRKVGSTVATDGRLRPTGDFVAVDDVEFWVLEPELPPSKQPERILGAGIKVECGERAAGSRRAAVEMTNALWATTLFRSIATATSGFGTSIPSMGQP
jgi:hypothetical protein